MTYEDMLNEVCAGKTAYRTTNPDMIVFREGDTIIRRTHRKCEVNQVFIATVEEQKATDWDIVIDEENHDELDHPIFILSETIGIRPFMHRNFWGYQ
ncbi:hypothetical protein IPGJFKPH_00267 [Klebsiella phage vB_KoM-Pickle]|jgi:hypothetical protein|uniref:Uncharacterized protein n=3 Tax=Viruses TaxID=10239 RepID=A0A6H0X1X5_9CAUD|nr:hypothetical protein KNT56_gp082 [Escherichia phage phT4A]MBG2194882.1 hypothetical protein [Klebsiella pneumoniae]QEG10228.1 hypothetical protein KMI7_62 [Klebsiella phage KMI7]QIW86102.1 hypothetical protein PKP2_50 [Klebsiella phage P-KP2]UUG67104.1 hypothetical protein 2DI_00223 [Klebsiella phage PSKm2DI]UXD79580.1 hypothetical protein OJNDCHOG_01580 [Klebsiella phage 150040]UYL05702.1 hypothetical protein PMMJPKLI_00162 [Klebsiella phage KP13MC5-1]UZO33487.1 hypothetical protein KEKK